MNVHKYRPYDTVEIPDRTWPDVVLDRCSQAGGPGVRLDTHVEAGATIPPNYDSLIAKLIVWGADRPSAIARGLRALGELEVDGVATTRDFAVDVLRSDAFASGEYTTSYVDKL